MRTAFVPVLLGIWLWMAAAGTAVAAREPGACGDHGVLSLGIFPRRSPALTITMFTPLARHLEKLTDCRVELKTARDFSHFWAAVKHQAYDVVHYNQYHYIRSSDDYQVVARNEEFGSDRIAGAIYVRRDSGITRLAQLAGKKVIFGGGADAMMSHIIPRHMLIEAGLPPIRYHAVFAPNPPNAVLAVALEQADAAGAGDVVIRLPSVTARIDPSVLRIVAVSEPVAHLPWAVKRTLPAAARSAVKAALLAFKQDPAGRSALEAAALTGIVAATDADYDQCRAIVARVRTSIPIE